MVELIFSKGTGEIYAFLNSVENLNMCTGMFRKTVLVKTSKVPPFSLSCRLTIYSL